MDGQLAVNGENALSSPNLGLAGLPVGSPSANGMRSGMRNGMLVSTVGRKKNCHLSSVFFYFDFLDLKNICIL